MLTTTQMQTLRTLANDDATAVALMQAADDVGLAAWFNAPAAPDFIVWRSSLSKHTILSNESSPGVAFQWSTTGGYISRTQAERDAFREIFNTSGAVDPSKPNVQAAFNDIFSGTGAGAINNRNHIAALSKRQASVAEKALAAGAGTTASPATLGFEGSIGYAEASTIRSL